MVVADLEFIGYESLKLATNEAGILLMAKGMQIYLSERMRQIATDCRPGSLVGRTRNLRGQHSGFRDERSRNIIDTQQFAEICRRLGPPSLPEGQPFRAFWLLAPGF